jgi:dihydrofolate synthase/folylpolyglutamate synthase
VLPPATSEQLLERLTRLHPKRIDLSLARIERLLAALGHPERRLPPVVHIAGTNGKGSSLAMLAAMLRADGRRVHRYISPHLVRFSERILIDDAPIEEVQLAEALDRCERANDGRPITFFEITTAAAFLAFAESRADAVLLETGMGGRLDATNVIERPRLVMLSPISLDHEIYLGSTVAAIAGEKAGIVKRGVPTVAGPQLPETVAVLEARAEAVRAPLVLHGRDWSAHILGDGLRVEQGGRILDLPRPALAGAHQIDNAGLAVVAAGMLGDLAPSPAAIRRGLMEARWPARLQRLTRGPLVEALPGGSTLLLDGGHNPAAGEVLARSLEAMHDGRPCHLVVGMLATKDAAGFLRPLVRPALDVRTVPIQGSELTRDPVELAATAMEIGLRALPAESPLAAIRAIAAAAKGPVLVLICGSLYLAGEILAENG